MQISVNGLISTCVDAGRRRHALLFVATATAMAVASPSFGVSTIDINGQNGYIQTGVGPDNVTPNTPPLPINVSNAESTDGDGASTNGSLVFTTADQLPGFADEVTNVLTNPITSGVVTVSIKFNIAPGSNGAFIFDGDNGPNPNVAPEFFDVDVEPDITTTGTFQTLQVALDLDTPGTPFVTTLDGVPFDGSGSGAGSYTEYADPTAPVSFNEVSFLVGQGVNGTAFTSPFYLDDLSVTDTIGGITSTVFADNYDEYITALPTTGVPEPASLGLLALGGMSLLGRRRRA